MRRLTFRRCGYVGVAGAAACALALAAQRGLSLWLEGGLIVIACLVFLGLALVTRRVAGRERLVYYHHEVVVLGVCAGVAALAGGPVLAHLDATALGLGVFLVCGRIGCLRAGCCHGRPARRGIVYGPEHAEAGFTRHLVGVPLVPVPAIEAVLVAGLVAAGAVATVGGQPAGTGLTAYVSGYAGIRFGFEFLRGDPLRPYWHGASEAQWTSTLLATAVLAGAAAGVLPFHWWDAAAAAGLAAALAVTVGRARRAPDVLHPRHLQEVVRAVRTLSAGGGGAGGTDGADGAGGVDGAVPRPALTSGGVQLSCGRTADRLHVTMSGVARPLDFAGAQALASVIAGLRPRADVEFVAGAASTWHVLLRG